MKRFLKVLFVVGSAVLLFAVTAQAQVTSVSVAGGNAAAADITLTGNIQSSLVLTITGSTTGINTLAGGPAVNMPARAAGTFNFGDFNTQSTTLSNGRIVRVNDLATPGAWVVAALVARATASGVAVPAINVGLSLSAGTLTTRFASGTGTWTTVAANAGGQLAALPASVSLCGGTCASASDYAHDLGVWVPDTQTTGAFTQIVAYDATM